VDIITAIKSRKSIRAFLPKPVPQETIKEILEAALRSPSALNTQPWEITVVTGEVLDRLRTANVDRLLAGIQPQERGDYDGIYKKRSVELGKDIFQLMDIKREDWEKRSQWQQRGFRYFDAPVALIISIDKSLRDTYAFFDAGAFVQTVCLAALNYGLGTCIEAQGVAYPDVVREHTGISEDKDLVMAVALGYPDPDFPANKLVSRREPVEELTTWLGF